MSAWVIWIVVAGLLAIGEILTLSFFMGPIAVAALLAAAAALLGAGTALQMVVFIVASAASLLVLRPIARRHLMTPPRIRTGTAALIGARALVLEDTFTSLPDMAAHHYPWLPARWLMRGKFNSLGCIGKYHGPLLMTHGTADSIVPFQYAEQLFAAANEPKQFIAEQGADHNDPSPHSFYLELRRFLETLPPAKLSSPDIP